MGTDHGSPDCNEAPGASVTESDEALRGAAAALLGLKDFQRQSVDYVFERLYGEGSTRRFLVADEVGLGKTMIARGVIARTIQHLRATVPRIDVVYICSNGDIARQNINRLKVAGEHVAMASRLTLLPTRVKELKKTTSGVNFISFTPATSFDVQGGLGQVEERLLIYAMLRRAWDLGAGVASMNVLQGNVSDAEKFRARALAYDDASIAEESIADFAKALDARSAQAKAANLPDLKSRFEALRAVYATARSSPSREERLERARVVGELRTALASSCIRALEPDLVILDEFQRFTHLLDGEDEASLLARTLFDWQDVRVLMLSATPYKMYTAADEAGGEEHYRDFARTLRFLEGGRLDGNRLENMLAQYRSALFAVDEVGGEDRLVGARRALEDRLRRVMVRTERLASTPDRNGMLKAVEQAAPQLRTTDVQDYLALQAVARTLEEPDLLEYWKSSPFLFNFMDADYKVKRELDAAIDDPETRGGVARALSASPTALLQWNQVERYQAIEAGNGRLRALLADTVDRGAHRLLWIPPALPYYGLGGPFADPALSSFTKRLVFSSWRVVPRVIAAMLSYEAERRMIGRTGEAQNTPEARKRRAPLLRFARSREGRLTGMPVLAMMYPSVYLARACDPARLAAERAVETSAESASMALDEVRDIVKMQIEVGLRRLPVNVVTEGPVDERWYWAAPLVLDRALEPAATKSWFAQQHLAAAWSGDETEVTDPMSGDDADVWQAHVEVAREFALEHGEPLGRMPDDLVDVLADLAIGAPGVTMLRSMLRVVGLRGGSLSDEGGKRVRNGAAKAASGFRALFNQPEVMSLLRGDAGDGDELPYWRRMLTYCVEGCLQSVLDEYAHVLRDHLGLRVGEAGDRVHEIAEQICEALALRTANIAVDDLGMSDAGRTLRPVKRRMRCHFALRFGDERNDTGEVATRADSVRKAFNSPFWPFVVATTSVGQEGLDFHTYCHAVVHWNVPSNPVDLEQREGRVHRYKGHAVRKNVALVHAAAGTDGATADPWETMFEKAREGRAEGATDIVPYWVYPVEGGAKIERHVPAFSLSREVGQMAALVSSLAVYRMVFGQPRQDDLVRYLETRIPKERLESVMKLARIELSPGGHDSQ